MSDHVPNARSRLCRLVNGAPRCKVIALSRLLARPCECSVDRIILGHLSPHPLPIEAGAIQINGRWELPLVERICQYPYPCRIMDFIRVISMPCCCPTVIQGRDNVAQVMDIDGCHEEGGDPVVDSDADVEAPHPPPSVEAHPPRDLPCGQPSPSVPFTPHVGLAGPSSGPSTAI